MLKVINSFYASTYDSPSFFNSNVVSQGFFWERVKVINHDNNWSFIRQSDNYESWINNFYLVDDLSINSEYEFIVIKNKFVEINQNINSNKGIVNYLSYGTKIPLFKSKNYSKDPLKNLFYIDYEKINFEKINNQKKPNCTICLNSKLRTKVLNAAFMMLGVSYFWGGKTSFGFDCSGFVQTIYNTEIGVNLPRDSIDQFNYVEKISKDELKIADLVFFKQKGIVVHVGIYVGSEKIIHCSGRVKVDSINKNDLDYNIVFNGLEIFYGKI